MEKKARVNDVEIWVPIDGADGYEVSNMGRVRSVDRVGEIVVRGVRRYRRYKGRVLVQTFDGKKNYLHVSIGGKSRNVHRLVAEAFIPNPNGFPEVNHKDEDKTNNSSYNLEWCNHVYNNNYGKKTSCTKGEKNPQNKFSEETIRCLRKEFIPCDPEYGLTPLAKKYGISVSHACAILHGNRWGWAV